jgi:ABC-type polysaccharide/polyol phosphate export permease
MFTTFQLTKRPIKERQAIDVKEIYLGRELPIFLLSGDSKAGYRQSFLARLWTVLPQLIPIIFFSFSRLFGVKSYGTRVLVFAVGGLMTVLVSNLSVTPLRAR